MPHPSSLAPSDLDKSYDEAPCDGGTRVSVLEHNRPLGEILTRVKNDTFCIHKHTMRAVDVGTSDTVGLAIKAIPATLVDPDGAHMLCDPDKSIHDCVPSTPGVDNAVQPLLTNCGWIADSFSNTCSLQEGDECNMLWDRCENGGFFTAGLSCQLDSTRVYPSKAHCQKCDTTQYTVDGDAYYASC